MRRPGIDRDQGPPAFEQCEQARNRQIVRDVVNAVDARERHDRRIERIFRPGTQQHDGVVRPRKTNVPQDRGPSLGGPIFVIHGVALEAPPHGPLVADLYQVQGPVREALGAQPRLERGPPRFADLEFAADESRRAARERSLRAGRR
jgi:hypothetical protein